MEKLARVQKDIEAVVDATRKAADERLAAAQQEVAREVKTRKEAEAVLAETSQALSAMREQQARVLSDQGELQATVSQMRDELKSKDAELAKLKPDHRPSFWSEPRQVGDSGRPTYDGLKQKLAEKDAQLDEALAIIKELTDAMQGKSAPRTPAACPSCGYGAAPADSAAMPAEAPAADAYAGGAASETEGEDDPQPGLAPSAPMFWVTTEGGSGVSGGAKLLAAAGSVFKMAAK